MAEAQHYAVLGAGHGGHALAAELALKGRRVTLFDWPEFEDALAPIRVEGAIRVTSRVGHFAGGVGEHVAPIARVTTDLAQALADVEVVMVVVPAQYHLRLAEACAPRLVPGQLVVVNPGGVGGALVFARAFARAGIAGVRLAQPSDLIYGCRRSGPARVTVAAKKRHVLLGAFPGQASGEVLARLAADFPEYAPAANVLEAGIGGPGMALHPIPAIMNAVQIDRRGAYTYDSYDITPTVARVIEAMDAERCAVLAALGLEAVPTREVLRRYYGADGRDFHETVLNVPGYRGQKAPAGFDDRYITEEIPTQMVPTALIGRALGVAVPVMSATIAYASAINGTDYWREGWTLERLGLDGLSPEGIGHFLATGTRPDPGARFRASVG